MKFKPEVLINDLKVDGVDEIQASIPVSDLYFCPDCGKATNMRKACPSCTNKALTPLLTVMSGKFLVVSLEA